MTYTVYADRLEAVKKGLDSLARKAERYSVPFSYTIGEEHPETVHVQEPGPGPFGEGTCLYDVDRYTVPAVDIDVDCDELIRKDGWTVCARIEHGDVGNIVTAFGDYEPDPKWFTAAPYCEHCQTNRFRSVTFVCKDSEGNTRQVGRTCLKDYTGINPSMAVLWAEVRDFIADESVSDYDPDDWCSRGITPMCDVETVLGHASDVIRELGYRRSDERDSTKENVLRRLGSHEVPSAEGKEKAKAVREWLTSLGEIAKAEDEAISAAWKAIEDLRASRAEWDDPDDFIDAKERLLVKYDKLLRDRTVKDLERNCIPLAVCGFSKQSHVGILAYMPLAYERYMERKAREEQWERERQAAAAASDYVEKVKERLTIHAATARLVTSWETDYGTTFLYKFTDDHGNVFVWRASRRFEASDGMTIKGTVKEHSEYNGVKQTVITRCAAA